MHSARGPRERRSLPGRRSPSSISPPAVAASPSPPRISAIRRGIVAILQSGPPCGIAEQNDCHPKARDREREREPDLCLGGSSGERAQREANEHDGGHYPPHEKAREIAA